jgi:predicted transcriptional regulator
MKGYSTALVESVKAADQSLPGVKLAKKLIHRNISVSAVAKAAGVSRAAVYSWFSGRVEPRPDRIAILETLIAEHDRDHSRRP